MLARAREKATRNGWANVTLIEADAEEVELRPESVDALLCFHTHDIMNSRRALEEAVRALRPGGRVAAAGVKRASAFPGRLLNLLTVAYSRPFITNFSDASRPWTHLESLLGSLDVEEHRLGRAYLAHGVKPRR
jgi:ubiquinone/menaquinone biosynthesis C-methylase UbiE